MAIRPNFRRLWLLDGIACSYFVQSLWYPNLDEFRCRIAAVPLQTSDTEAAAFRPNIEKDHLRTFWEVRNLREVFSFYCAHRSSNRKCITGNHPTKIRNKNFTSTQRGKLGGKIVV